MSNYEDISINKPFRILKKNKDQTVFKKDKDGLLIYFHDLKCWINPPTDRNCAMEVRLIRNIDQCGVEYLAEGEEL